MAPAAAHGGSSWNLVAHAAFGTVGSVVTSASLLTAQLGVVSSYLDLVGNTLMATLGLSVLSSRLLLWVVLSAACMLRPMRSVAWLSTAGLLVYLYIIFLVGYFGASAPPRQAPLVYADASQVRTQGLKPWTD